MNLANHGSSELVTDPVCGMQIDPTSAATTLERQGRAVHFCSARCAAKFKTQPDRYPIVTTPPKPASHHCDCG